MASFLIINIKPKYIVAERMAAAGNVTIHAIIIFFKAFQLCFSPFDSPLPTMAKINAWDPEMGRPRGVQVSTTIAFELSIANA